MASKCSGASVGLADPMELADDQGAAGRPPGFRSVPAVPVPSGHAVVTINQVLGAPRPVRGALRAAAGSFSLVKIRT